jgi:hypothetical protein
VWDELHPTARPATPSSTTGWWPTGEDVLTGDSFFHLAGYGESLPGLNLCGAGRVVCLVDPVGDVYACPFAIHDEFLAGNVRQPGGFAEVWRSSDLFTSCAGPRARGPVRPAATTTPAAVGAWRPSSSPACPSTDPTPNASSAMVSTPWPDAGRPHLPKPSLDHSRPGPTGHRYPCWPGRPVPTGPATRAP